MSRCTPWHFIGALRKRMRDFLGQSDSADWNGLSAAILQNQLQSFERIPLTGSAWKVRTIRAFVGRAKNGKAPLLKFQHQFCIGCLNELGVNTRLGFGTTIPPMSFSFVCPNPMTEVKR